MVYNKDDWISQRAYAIWEEEGRPFGRETENWQQAAAEFDQLQTTKASIDGTDLIAMLRATGRLMRESDKDRARIVQDRSTIAKP
ncbi:DUF2934 family protein [Rhizobium azibense]|uniref:DUF2934 family protein n=1 Tax=Rhizobium azibense TaxID=1136135 RepID=A0A4R3R9Q7_9HYPH|nr:DUF2934 domain-containing protein [Rhizobium azibense]TCU30689.1 DUF2934 family protein [Rhizobium azibense]TCU41299.1 DUF2934 family protein [Rhizobium azibense]